MKNIDKKIILYVDDNPSECLKSDLEEAGYFVVTYKNAEDTMEEVENGLKFDVAIIDRSLKDGYGSLDFLDGDDLMRIIKNVKKVPIISYSGWPDKPKHSDVHIWGCIDEHKIIPILNELFKNGK